MQSVDSTTKSIVSDTFKRGKYKYQYFDDYMYNVLTWMFIEENRGLPGLILFEG